MSLTTQDIADCLFRKSIAERAQLGAPFVVKSAAIYSPGMGLREGMICVCRAEDVQDFSLAAANVLYVVCGSSLEVPASVSEYICCRAAVSIPTALNAVNELIAWDTSLVEASNEIYSSMIHGFDIDGTLETVGKLLGLSILVTGAKSEVIAYYCPEVSGPQPMSFFMDRDIVPTFSASNCKYIVYMRKMLSKYILINYVKNRDDKISNIICDISVGLADTARVFFRSDSPPIPIGSVRIIRALCEGIHSEMFWSNASDFSLNREYGAALLTMLDSEDIEPDRLRELAKKLRLPTYMSFRVFAFTHKAPGSLDIYYSSFSKEVSQILPHARIAIHNGNLAAVACCDDETSYRASLDVLAKRLEHFNMNCGVSRSFSDLSLLRKHYLQAVDAARTVYEQDRFAEPSAGRGHSAAIREYEKCELFILFAHVEKTGLDLKNWVNPIVDLLIQHDTEHATSYVRTLHAYIRFSRKAQPTAEALYIHRNTLDYRLRKIQELTGIVWEDGELISKLFLSLSVIQYLYQKEHPAE